MSTLCQYHDCGQPIPTGGRSDRRYCQEACRQLATNARRSERERQYAVGTIIPSELLACMAADHWTGRLSYTQLAAKYPGYGRSTIARAVRQATHSRRYQPSCPWCKQRFRPRRPDAKWCSERCRAQHGEYHRNLRTSIRPPDGAGQVSARRKGVQGG